MHVSPSAMVLHRSRDCRPCCQQACRIPDLMRSWRTTTLIHVYQGVPSAVPGELSRCCCMQQQPTNMVAAPVVTKAALQQPKLLNGCAASLFVLLCGQQLALRSGSATGAVACAAHASKAQLAYCAVHRVLWMPLELYKCCCHSPAKLNAKLVQVPCSIATDAAFTSHRTALLTHTPVTTTFRTCFARYEFSVQLVHCGQVLHLAHG